MSNDQPQHVNASTNDKAVSSHGLGRWLLRLLLVGVLPLVIVGAGALGAAHLVRTSPQARQRPPQRSASLVKVRELRSCDERAVVAAMGAVIAAKEIVVQPQVSGEIIELSSEFVPGGRVEAGDLLVRIDPRDYQIAVQDARSRVAQAEYELKLEKGYQDIARREWELLDMSDEASDFDRELALRKPHLAKSQASLAAANGALEKAELDLSRTTIRAPFNGIIRAEYVDVGAQVTPQTQLATLVGTDEYWVQASVPVGELHWITIPQTDGGKGSAARVRQYLGDGVATEWRGEVFRLMGDLEPEGRMARLLISVRDPLGLTSTSEVRLPLLIGSYVDVAIEGHELQEVFAIDRKELHEENTVWIMDNEGNLDIRSVEVLFRERDRVFVDSGLQEGELLVTSDLSAAVEGMPLRRVPSDDESAGASKEAPAPREKGGVP